jgi:hypothetical protein
MSDLSNLAHLRRALRVSTPAFARHIAVFVPHRDDDNHDTKAHVDRKVNAGRMAFEALQKIHQRLKADAALHQQWIPEGDLPLVDRYRSSSEDDLEILCENIRKERHRSTTVWLGIFLGFHVRAMFYFQSEYFGLTFLIDDHSDSFGQFPGEPLAHKRGSMTGTWRDPEKMKDEIQRRLKEFHIHSERRARSEVNGGENGAVEAAKKAIEKAAEEAASVLGEGLPHRHAFHHLIWQALDQLATDCGATQPYVKATIAQMFLDFRGAVMCADPVDGVRAYPLGNMGLQPDHSNELPAFAPMSLRLRRDSVDPLDYIAKHEGFFLDFLGMGEDGSLADTGAEGDRLEGNVILCRLLRDDAIFGSAIGNLPFPDAQARLTRKRQEKIAGPNPLLYFVVYSGANRDQLGRLIRRLHTLTELRFAALIDHDKLYALSAPIRNLGQNIDVLLTKGSSGAIFRPMYARQHIRNYGELSLGRVEDRNGNKQTIGGGAAYRLNKSIYYMESFRARLDDLNIGRIRGWQGYDHFIMRNLDQTFRAIQSFRDRYRELGDRVSKLEALVQSTESENTAIAVSLVSGLAILVTIAEFVQLAAGPFGDRLPFSSATGQIHAVLLGIVVVCATLAAWWWYRVQLGAWLLIAASVAAFAFIVTGPFILEWWSVPASADISVRSVR